jgi:NO-binding membrane sensor protein with MHYT domain
MAATRTGSGSTHTELASDGREVVVAGSAIWAVTFIAALAIFPLHAEERPLFESIMPVVLATATVVASCRAFLRRQSRQRPVRYGLILGTAWLAISLALDALMFSRGPMQMAPGDYLKDIGVTYLMIVVIPVGFGYLAAAYRRP